jgi:hypothetical protein
VSIHLDKSTPFDGSRQDFRPCPGEQQPVIPVSGFLLRHAADVTLRDCHVTWGANRPPYFRHALDAVGCPGLDPSGLAGESADPARWSAVRRE